MSQLQQSIISYLKNEESKTFGQAKINVGRSSVPINEVMSELRVSYRHINALIQKGYLNLSNRNIGLTDKARTL